MDLPASSGFNFILVVVGRLSKIAHFITYNKAINMVQTAYLILKEVIHLHGIPENVSDRQTEFFYNNSIHTSTKKALFFANYGFNLCFDIHVPLNSTVPSAKNKAIQL
ncbi:18151_t:CDS:2 [Dentiscutata erythropus]|uniref:18151_t:CDS:1 n=1 Tax=Dentiscutata erythropus TaxID=1348616 RepID=A0A9N9HQP9_9GLOM|nr:18151_t:CDS:2 [Dentiscutata erythropus]